MVYSSTHRPSVAGLILLDGVSPQYAQDFSTNWAMDLGWNAIVTAKHTGLLWALSDLNFINNIFVDIDTSTEELKKLKIEMALKNANNSDIKEERKRMNDNGFAVQNGTLRALPLLVLSAPNNGYEN